MMKLVEWSSLEESLLEMTKLVEWQSVAISGSSHVGVWARVVGSPSSSAVEITRVDHCLVHTTCEPTVWIRMLTSAGCFESQALSLT